MLSAKNFFNIYAHFYDMDYMLYALALISATVGHLFTKDANEKI